jgi:hypothetical protein
MAMLFHPSLSGILSRIKGIQYEQSNARNHHFQQYFFSAFLLFKHSISHPPIFGK